MVRSCLNPAAGPQNPATAGPAAFSLLEAVLVLAILAVLAAMAAPRYGRAAARYRAHVAAQRVAADLELARRSARAAGAGRTVTFSVAAHRYVLGGVAGLDAADSTYAVDLSQRPYQAGLLSADFGGDATVAFDGYGAADSNGTVVVQAGPETRTVRFTAATGKARVE